MRPRGGKPAHNTKLDEVGALPSTELAEPMIHGATRLSRRGSTQAAAEKSEDSTPTLAEPNSIHTITRNSRRLSSVEPQAETASQADDSQRWESQAEMLQKLRDDVQSLLAAHQAAAADRQDIIERLRRIEEQQPTTRTAAAPEAAPPMLSRNAGSHSTVGSYRLSQIALSPADVAEHHSSYNLTSVVAEAEAEEARSFLEASRPEPIEICAEVSEGSLPTRPSLPPRTATRERPPSRRPSKKAALQTAKNMRILSRASTSDSLNEFLALHRHSGCRRGYGCRNRCRCSNPVYCAIHRHGNKQPNFAS